MNKDFYTFYTTELLLELEILEKRRKKIKLWFYLIFWVGYFLYAVNIYILSLGIEALPTFLFAISIIFAMFGWFYIPIVAVNNRIQSFRKLRVIYKKRIMFKILDFMFDDYEYIPRQKLSYKVLNNSNLLMHNRFNISESTMGEDYLKCVFGNSIIQFSEMNVYKFRLIKSTISFKGLFISASFNKNLNYRTIVLSKSKTSYLTRLSLAIKEALNNGHVITLENSEFNNNFLVYGEDQVEARYVLSSSFMEKLLAYKEKINSNIAFSFVNNRMYAAIHTSKNHFEPNFSKPLTDFEEVLKHYTHFKIFTEIVQDLELQLRLWNE